MCFRITLSALASLASWPTAGARLCYQFANSCCECQSPAVLMLISLKEVLHCCGSVHVVAARCCLFRASTLPNSTRPRCNGDIALTALNHLQGTARSTKASARTLHVCSGCAA